MSPVTVQKAFAQVAAVLWLMQNYFDRAQHRSGIQQHHRSAKALWTRSSAGAKPEQLPSSNGSYAEVPLACKTSPDSVQKLP